MAAEPLPQIDLRRCTGCHRCVEICPTGALDQVAGKAVLRYPERCTYCSACEERCPTGAIALPFLIVLAKHNDV
jgi:formate hydrogenlyase subunit 6/NADH:ubiquinone oxidoreductase subunit I